MRIKTADLTGPTLVWAVATCEGYECLFEDEVSGPWLVPQEGFLHDEKSLSQYSPPTNWSQGGPIIEREGISLLYLYVTDDPFRWAATQKPTIKKVKPESVYGPTPLIAAMRCYVASRLGDEVDIPEELL